MYESNEVNMQYLRVILGISIGAIIGFGIGYFGKCATGTCPFTSNPIVSTILGALIGGMITLAK